MKQLIITLSVLFLGITTQAHALVGNSLHMSEAGCDSSGLPILDVTANATFDTNDNVGVDQAEFRVYDGTGTLVANSGSAWTTGQTDVENTIRFSQTDNQWVVPPVSNPLRAVLSDSGSVDVDLLETVFVSSCFAPADDDSGIALDGSVRLPEVGIYIYPTVDSEGLPGITIWGIDADNEGTQVAQFSNEQLTDYAAMDLDENLEIGSAEGGEQGAIHVYWLTTDELQINVGADAEGWVRVTIISGFGTEDSDVYGYSFNVYPTP